MSICLQHLASIQPRTSHVKFARSPCTDYSPRCKLQHMYPELVRQHAEGSVVQRSLFDGMPQDPEESLFNGVLKQLRIDACKFSAAQQVTYSE